LLEKGVIAEFDGKPDAEKFKQALKHFEECSALMVELDKKFGELIAIHRKGKLNTNFEKSLERILKQANFQERPSLEKLRYSNVAKDAQQKAQPKLRDLLDIMESQRSALQLVKRQLDDMIGALRNVIPLAEKGEFAAMMLSGRHGFSDKVQQSVHLINVYSQFYTGPCMATIDATMQSYPSGLEWLKQSVADKQGQ
jgi:hypothetical protein